MNKKPKRVERQLSLVIDTKSTRSIPPPKLINPQLKGLTQPCYRPISYVRSDDSTYVPGSSGWERSLLESIYSGPDNYRGLDTDTSTKRLRALRIKITEYLSAPDVLRSFPNMEPALEALQNCSSKSPCNLRFCPYCHFGYVMKNIHLLYPVLGDDCLTFTWVVDDLSFEEFHYQTYTGSTNSSLFGRESPNLASKDWHRKQKDIIKAMCTGFEKENDCSVILLMFPDVKWKAEEQKFSVHYHGILRCTEHVKLDHGSDPVNQTHSSQPRYHDTKRKSQVHDRHALTKKLLLKLRQKRINRWRIDYSSPVVDLPRYLSYQQKIPFVQWKDARSLDLEDYAEAEKLMVLWSMQDQLTCLSYGLGPSVSKQLLSTVDYSLEFSWRRMRGPKTKGQIDLGE